MAPGGSSGAPVAPAALIDTHVHFHDCFDLVEFLAAAATNLERRQEELGLAPAGDDAEPPAWVLLVMETDDRSLSSRLSDGAERLEEAGWQCGPTAEPGTATLRSGGGPPLHIVEGRQVVTAERLEVLATPCSDALASGLSLGETLRAARRSEAVAILPWGFGKWTGRRGRIVRALLESPRRDGLLLGDNGGRLELGVKPRLLTLGAQRGFPVVRGSDPLPIASQVRRVGSSGSLLRGPFDPDRPATSVRALLGDLRRPPRAFGRGPGPISFVLHQAWMQLRRSGR